MNLVLALVLVSLLLVLVLIEGPGERGALAVQRINLNR